MAITPYPYQERATVGVLNALDGNPFSRPCLVLPTGAGKGFIATFLAQRFRQAHPNSRIMITVDSMFLVSENHKKMIQAWPAAPCGVFSAGVGRRDLLDPILHVGIQSVYGNADLFGRFDLIIIDEAHMVSYKGEGKYFEFLSAMAVINPDIRFIGMTATPWRLGHPGHIAENGAFFNLLIEGASIEELVALGFLCRLHSKHMEMEYDVSGVKKRGGEYVESALQDALNTTDKNRAVVLETIARAEKLQCKSWIVFCCGIEHAKSIHKLLAVYGISSACLTGEATKKERLAIVAAFKAGRITAMVSVEMLIKGFDHPAADLGVMLRPTMSPVLYVQMVGRIMRASPGKHMGYIFDFAGLVKKHGPITSVGKPEEKSGPGEMPVKVCERCFEIVHARIMVCPNCLEPFPEPEKKEEPPALHNQDIMGIDPDEMAVVDWEWKVHTKRQTGAKMLLVNYFGKDFQQVGEFLPVRSDNDWIRNRSQQIVADIASASGVSDEVDHAENLSGICQALQQGAPPSLIAFKSRGKFFDVLRREWPQPQKKEEIDW